MLLQAIAQCEYPRLDMGSKKSLLACQVGKQLFHRSIAHVRSHITRHKGGIAGIGGQCPDIVQRGRGLGALTGNLASARDSGVACVKRRIGNRAVATWQNFCGCQRRSGLRGDLTRANRLLALRPAA
jgi:hypothetical protein